jgi:hypothetical protein
MFHKKRSVIFLVSVVLVSGISVLTISKVFVFAPATQTTIVSSPFVPARQAESGANAASNISSSATPDVSSNQPQLTTEEFDKRLKHNLDDFFSKPAERNPQAKAPEPVHVQ